MTDKTSHLSPLRRRMIEDMSLRNNSRLVAMDETRVRFRWRNYRQQNKAGVMKLDAHEFIRRFLLHGLPEASRH